MFRTRNNPVMIAVGFTAGLAIGIPIGAAITAPEAHADGNAYLAMLYRDGVNVVDPAAMINAGYMACQTLGSSSMTGADIASMLANGSHGYISQTTANTIVFDAVVSLCPEFLPGGSANPTTTAPTPAPMHTLTPGLNI